MIYSYRSTDDDYKELLYSMGKAPSEVVIRGKKYYRSYKDENVGFAIKTIQDFPDVSLGVAEHQIPEFKAELDKAGIDTEVTKTDDPIIKNKSHQLIIANLRFGEEYTDNKLEK